MTDTPKLSSAAGKDPLQDKVMDINVPYLCRPTPVDQINPLFHASLLVQHVYIAYLNYQEY
jgi:hypothetical protein